MQIIRLQERNVARNYLRSVGKTSQYFPWPGQYVPEQRLAVNVAIQDPRSPFLPLVHESILPSIAELQLGHQLIQQLYAITCL